MNEDFQTRETRKFAESIYSGLTNTLTKAIISKLGLEEVYTDEEGKSMPVEFDYAFKQLQDAGFTLNHVIVEDEGKATIKIKFFKLEEEVEYNIKTTYNISIT